MAEGVGTLVAKLSELDEDDFSDFISTVMTEHYVAKAGSRAGRMVHADCRICDWLQQNVQLTEIAFLDKPAADAFARLIERCDEEPTEDHMALRIKQSWLVLYQFIRNIAREGIFEDLNDISRRHLMPHGLLSLLRQVENQLQQGAVKAMLIAEGEEYHDDEV